MKKPLLVLLGFFVLVSSSFSQNLNLTLAGTRSYGSQALSNIWGWVDTADSKEYALVGAENGTSIVDVTNPAAPVEIVFIPVPATSQNCTWREIKTVGDYAYITTECGTMGLQIVELTNLPATTLAVTTWKPVFGPDTLETIHALHAENGRIYLYGTNIGNGGAIIADVTTTPMAPVYLGSYDAKYIHDGYVRNDTMYAGHIYDGECAIVDATNPASPSLLASFLTPTMFTHNTWLSTNGKTCVTTDENSNSYVGAFDISNHANIFETDRIQTNPGSGSIVHNTYAIQKGGADYAVTSWYTEGITVTDITRPYNLVQVGNYDTYTPPSGGFNGCWGVYPYLPSGTIVASDINTGLYVFTPNYVRASYLEGVVKHCSTGAPLSGVNVTVQLVNPQSNAHTDITDFQGKYEVGVAVADTYLVVFSKIGFLTDSDTVVLTSGVVLLDTFQLCPVATFAYSGNVFDIATSTGIAGADVSIYNSFVRWDTVTNASGNFTVPNMFTGTYVIAAGKWGYVSKCLSSQSVSPTFPPVSIGLNKGIYDDFTWDWGWAVSGNAVEGIWEWADPLGTFYQSTAINPDNDVTNDCGTIAWVTGNSGTAPDDDDVDGGVTILTSPTFDLSAYTEPYIFFSRWKAFYFGTTDSLRIMLSNGITSAAVENVVYGSVGQSVWANRNYKISTFITPTANMNVIVRAVDGGADDVVEAAFDKFYILDSTSNSVNEFANGVNVVVYPNPFHEYSEVIITDLSSGYHDLKLKIVDVTGREIRSISQQNGTGIFRIEKGNLLPGVYFYHIVDGFSTIAAGKLCIE